MQLAPDLGIPDDVKPAIESIRGRWYQKMSPRTRHSFLQFRMAKLLERWAGEGAQIGTEWRFFLVREEPPSSLVPDVAWVAEGRLPDEAGDARERPVLAPDIVVEILSPGDRKRLLETKIGLYFAHGSSLVIVVDPNKRSVRMCERDRDQTCVAGTIARSTAYPTLGIDVDALFANIV
jgi:Uma2 family endonuclease